MPQRSKNRRVTGALLLGLFATWATPSQSVEIRSGLPWASGVNKPVQEFGRWRGRPVDFRTVFFGTKTWDHIRGSANGRPGMQTVVGLAMLPYSHAGQLRQCAAGAFDAPIRAIRDNMLNKGWKGSYLRLGWEANRVAGSRGKAFAWAAQGDGSTWRACFRRWVGILNPGTKNFRIVWNMANQGTFKGSIEKLWPGNDVVDVVGSQFYDRCPPITSSGEFQRRVNARDKYGNPAGPKSWLEWAKARGKKWALPEWGIGGSRTICKAHGFDNPVFMREMFNFLRANAGNVAFESYFNGADSNTGSHVIYPVGPNPRSSAVYQQLW